MPHGKTCGGKIDRHDQIQPATGETTLEKIYKERFLLWVGKTGGIEWRFVDINRRPQLSGERRPESRRHGTKRGDVAPEGLDNEDPFSSIGRRGEPSRCKKDLTDKNNQGGQKHARMG